MKPIFVKAFLDQNLGDDMMLIELFRFFPNTAFYLSCDENHEVYYKTLFSDYANVELTRIPLYQISKFGKDYFSGIVQIGGSILQGVRMIGCYYRWRNIHTILKQKKRGLFYNIIGCNIGPFLNKITQEFVKEEIKSSDCISVRDKESSEFVKKIPYRGKLIYADDILLSATKRILKDSYKKEGCLGISVMLPLPLRQKKDEIIYSYTSLAEEYIRRTNCSVKLLCFNTGDQGDDQIAKAITSKCVFPEKISIVRYSCGNVSEMIAAIASCQAILAVRFHSLILAYAAEVPIYPVIYSGKTKNFLRDIGWQKEDIQMKNFAQIDFDKVVDDILLKRNLLVASAENFSSERHFDYLKLKGAK